MEMNPNPPPSTVDELRALERAATPGEWWHEPGLLDEADAQAAVEAWLNADEERYQSGGRQYHSGWYFTLWSDVNKSARQAFFGATRLEALTKAAEFCRANMPTLPKEPT